MSVANGVNAKALWWAGPLTVVAAVLLVFAGFALWSARAIAIYRKVALVVLALSMLPDAWLPGKVPGATWPIAIVLTVTHVAAWLPTVLILTNRALISGASGGSRSTS